MRVFYKFWKQLLVKSVLAKSKKKKNFLFCMDYESHKYMFRMFIFFKISMC